MHKKQELAYYGILIADSIKTLPILKNLSIVIYLDKWLILGRISQENHSCKLLTFYFPSPEIMVHKDKPGFSKEKGKQKPNPTEKVTALVYGGQICERFTLHELQILVSIPPKSSQKKK